MMKTHRIETADKRKTEIGALSELGPELDEGQLVTVTGGTQNALTGKPTGGPCSGCH